jgi:hypothetical protein
MRLLMRTRRHPSGEWRLRGVESRNTDFAFGSSSDVRAHELIAKQLTPKLHGQTVDFRGGFCSAMTRSSRPPDIWRSRRTHHEINWRDAN